MASQVVVEDFTGAGTLAGTSPDLTGISTATWSTTTSGGTPNNAFTRSAGGATVVLPHSSIARIEFDTLTHTSGVTTVQGSVRPGTQMRAEFELDEYVVWMMCHPDGSGSWTFDGASFGSGSFTGSALSSPAVMRIEITTTQARFYVNNTLKATHSSGGMYSGATVTAVRFLPQSTFANGEANGTTVAALREFQVKTEAASGPLGPAGVGGDIVVRSPLGAPILHAITGRTGIVAVHSPLGFARVIVEHDWTGLLAGGGAVEFYVCDLIDDGEVVARLPISSWQGTARLDASSYLQAVVPAVADHVSIINSLSDSAIFSVSRGARLPTGEVIVSEMARSVIDEVQLDQGAQRYTCTLSGYSAAIGEPITETPPARTLQGVRSVSSSTGSVRVRCEVDWFLKPGAPAVAGALALVPTYISYFVGNGDAYMDAGESA